MTELAEIAVIAVAAGIAGFTGFGFNLIAVPLLAIVMPTKDAIVVALVVGIVVQLVLASTSIRKASGRRLAILGGGAAIGVVFGTAVFRTASTSSLNLAIALLTFGFGIYLLLPSRNIRLRSGIPIHVAVGGLSGLLAAATGMSGPPVVAYLVRSEKDAAVARATIAGFVALAAGLAVIGLAASGSAPESSMIAGLRHIPVGLIGVLVGSAAFRRRPTMHRFASAVLLMTIGMTSLFAALLAG